MLKALSGALKLTELDRSLDQAFQAFADDLGDDPLRHAFLADYVGFPIYDVLLYAPSGEDLGPDPLTPIQVARVSPRDSVSLEGAFSGLKSRSLMGFLGFFNREYREHDYLWGRLNGADRLVDIVASVAPGAFTAAELEVFKHRLFEVIVAREKRRLYRCDDELAALEALLAEQAAAQSSPA